MIDKEIVLDAEAAIYLPYARNQLARLTRLLGNNWSRTTEVNGVTLFLCRQGNLRTIRLSGGVNYEFFTSEEVESGTLATPGFNPWTDGRDYNAGSFTRNKKPVLSTVLDSPDWLYYPTAEGWSFEEQGLLTSGAWGRERLEPYISWLDKGKSYTTSHRMMPSGMAHNGGLFSRQFNTPLIGHEFYRGINIVPTHFSSRGREMGIPALEPKVFGRHAAVQGNWMIVTDSHGRFHTFPRGKYQDREGFGQYTAPNDLVRTATPPYPAWVTIPSTSSYAQVEWVWAFNRDATKAVTVALHRDLDGGYVLNPYIEGYYRASPVRAADVSQFHPEYCVASSNDTPGLLEFGITIDEEGEITFELLTEDYFGVSGRWYIDAAYLLDDDRLVTAECECYAPTNYTDAAVLAAEEDPEEPTFDDLWAFYVVKDREGTELFKYTQDVESRLEWQNYADSVTDNGYGAPASFSGKRLVVVPMPTPTYYHMSERQGTELSTLSFRLTSNSRLRTDPFPLDWNYRLVHLAVDAIDPILGHTAPTMDRPEGYVKVTSALVVGMFALRDSWAKFRQSFSVHPKGHWSFYDAAACRQHGELFDIVAQNGKDRKTHRELFNKAYELTRGYDFYTAEITNIGGFRIAGIWVDKQG